MRKKKINKIMIIVVLLLFMVMGIGYSYLSKTLGVNGNVIVKPKLCKRAEILHTETCNWSNETYFCNSVGYSLGDDIVYGNYGISGELKSGDAFDCDVDGDGVYDSNTERFYYVSDYYDTTTKSFNSNYATLVYYNNVKVGESNNTATFAYDSSNQNWHGPVTGYVELPSTSQWSRVTLLQDTRQLNEKGDITTGSGSNILGTFTYTDKAARLLTAQEVNQACGITVGSYKTGELDTCEYFLENTSYSKSSLVTAWWIESAHSSYSGNVWYVHGYNRRVDDYRTSNASDVGFRPAIDVLKSNILY